MKIQDFKGLNSPFTIYDFFGYLFPGATFWILIFFSGDIHRLIEIARGRKVDSGFFFENFADQFNSSPFLSFFIIAIASYISGHIIASISSYFFERVLVEKYLGYPTDNLLKLKGDPRIEEITWIKRRIQFLKNAVYGKFIRPYSNDFIDKFKVSFKNTFKLESPNSSDIFWLSFEYVANCSPVSLSRSLHFLNLYGFSRNLSMTFLLAGILQAIFCNWLEFFLYFLLCTILYINYLKLLRRTNDEVLRTFFTLRAMLNQEKKIN